MTTYGVFDGARLLGAYRSRDKALRLVAEALAGSAIGGALGMQVFERGLLVQTLAGDDLVAAAEPFASTESSEEVPV